VTDYDKHTSLSRYGISYGRTKFYNMRPVAQMLEIELATHLVKKQLKQAA